MKSKKELGSHFCGYVCNRCHMCALFCSEEIKEFQMIEGHTYCPKCIKAKIKNDTDSK